MSRTQAITFDIETIPFQGVLTNAHEEEILKKSKLILKTPNPTEEELASVRDFVMAVNPYMGEIICIGLHGVTFSGEEQLIALTGTEKEILTKFWSGISEHAGVFVSFNGVDFDVPFIIKRSIFHQIRPTNNNFMDLKRFSRWPHFDVRAVMGDFDKFASGTLDLITQFCGVQSPKEGDIKAEDVYKAYKDGRISEIADYCLRDVKSTYEVYSIIKNYTFKPR